MERRDFMKAAGVLGSGLLVPDFLRAEQAVEPPKLRLAIIGCGTRGKGLVHVLNQLGNRFELVAICDVLDFRLKDARALKISNPYKEYKDHRTLLDDKTIDAVVISTPLNTHFEIAKNALLAGKHVYLEKTMTYSIPQALELVKLADARPAQVLQVGHQYRYTPLYYKVRDMIAKGYLGKVTQIDCRWDRNGNWRWPVPEPQFERAVNWRMYKEYSGGLAAELLSHQIDFINWAFNTHADEVTASGGIDFYKDGRETCDNIQAILRYNQAGMIGNFGATCANKHDGYLFKLKGSKGTISLLVNEGTFYPEKFDSEKGIVDGVTGATKLVVNKDGGIPIVSEPMKDGTWYALEDFYRCVTTKAKPDSNVHTGAKTACTVHMINKAIESKAIQTWKTEYGA